MTMRIVLLIATMITMTWVGQDALGRMAREFTQKAATQDQRSQVLERWSTNYRQLEASEAEWKASFRHERELTDLVAFRSILKFQEYGLELGGGALAFNAAEVVTVDGKDVGLYASCVSSGGNSVTVYAGTYKRLVAGLQAFASRKDVQFERISVIGREKTPKAEIERLCLLVRQGE